MSALRLLSEQQVEPGLSAEEWQELLSIRRELRPVMRFRSLPDPEQALEAFAHIGCANGQVDSRGCANPEHDWHLPLIQHLKEPAQSAPISRQPWKQVFPLRS